MSTVKTVKYQVGTDGTSTNNFTIYQPDPPDGTMRVGNGNADAPTDVAQVNGDGFKFTSNIQIGTDATSSNNFTIYQPATPDGTLRIGVGNADSPTEVGQFNANGYKPSISTTPILRARKNANQTVTLNVLTKITWEITDYDTTSDFDSTTNYRWTPSVSGYYWVYTKCRLNDSTVSAIYDLSIQKNGSTISSFSANQDRFTSNSVGRVIYMNGTTDYLEVYLYQNATHDVRSGQADTSFEGHLIQQA